MYFGTKAKLKQVPSDSLVVGNDTIEVVETFKYLGVLLDGSLKFDAHTEYVCKQVCARLKTLGGVRCYIGTKTSLYLYNSLIAPMFTFNDYIYDGLDQKHCNKLQTAQNNCIRTCLACDKRTPRSELYEASNVLSLCEQRVLSTSTLVYLGMNQQSTPFVNNLFRHVTCNTPRETRSMINRELYIPRVKLKCCEQNIRHRGPVYYNKIPLNIRDSETHKSFRRKLKRSRCLRDITT